MAEVYKYNITDAFWQLGANIAVQFTLTSDYNRYGCWGLTDDITNLDRNHKFQAARELMSMSKVEGRKVEMDFELGANYPNPFNPQTTILFSLPKQSHVMLEVYDISGKIVKTVVDQFYGAGQHHVIWDSADQQGRAVPSGVYLYRLRAADFVETRSMVLLR